jgi:hypothetical protein
MSKKDLQDYALNLAAYAEMRQSDKPKPKISEPVRLPSGKPGRK